jgi:hypothetical protein
LIDNKIDFETDQKRLILNLGEGENNIPEFMIRIILIWTMVRNAQPTEGFQPKPIYQHFGCPGQTQLNLRIAPKLQENPVDKNSLGQDPFLGTMSNSLSKEYSVFQNDYYPKSLPKRFDTNQCSARKFSELARDTRANDVKYDRALIGEARAVIQSKLQNLVIKPTRANKLEAQRIDLNLTDQVHLYTLI